MTRNSFVVMMLACLILAILISGRLSSFLLIAVCLYSIMCVRGKYLGFSMKENFMLIVAGPLSENWWKLWQKDDRYSSK